MKTLLPLILVTLISPLVATLAAPPAPTIHLEAAEAALSGNTLLTQRHGYSGRGYAGDFQADGAKMVWTIPQTRAGIYQATIRYSAPNGQKGYDLVVNGAKSSGMFAGTGDTFATQDAGKVELRDGTNTVEIQRGWGYYDINALDLTPAPAPPALPKPPATLCDPRATPEARALMQSLVSRYRDKTLSGQYDQADNDLVRAATGKLPAIRGGDLIDYSPTRLAHGADPKGQAEALISAARAGQIITLSWHWNAPADLYDRTYTDAQGKSVNAPWWRGFYTDASTFDVQKALADPNSADYKLLLSDMDAIAVQLQKLQDAHVPVLWRPLHEAEGGWFWWGARGPGPFKQLWRLMYDRLTNYHGLHNLIWVDCSGTNPDWYPGDDVVDIVGIDAYPSDVSDPLSGTWETLQKQHGGQKLVALTEFGGVPDVDRMRRFGVRWSYFVSWTGDLGPKKMSPQDLTRIYRSPSVITKVTL